MDCEEVLKQYEVKKATIFVENPGDGRITSIFQPITDLEQMLGRGI